MSAVRTKTVADLSRRRLQSIIIALVILLSSGAATLALSLLVESDAPYDHAFAQANGAHLVITYAGNKVTPAQLTASASAHGVTGALGPLPLAETPLSFAGGVFTSPSGKGGYGPGPLGIFTIAGRDSPNTTVDRLTMESGRWARAPGEIVLTRRMADDMSLGVDSQLTAGGGAALVSLRVVGVAASISPYVDAWVEPRQLPALLAGPKGPQPLHYLMLYRVSPARTAADLRAAEQSITAHLPAGAVMNTENYLDIKRNADLLSAVMVPFLLAFSVFALLAAVLIIANVVAGVVIASYREIGIMKSVGFTPAQVMAVRFGQILAPALAGCLIGIPLGTLGSQPFLQDTAHALGLPAPFTAALPVDALVLAAVACIAALAAFLPAWRAGHISAVAAITLGSAPAAERGAAVGRGLHALPLPRPLTLGLSDALARPLRSAMTLGAILTGVVTLVFALSLHLSLQQVAGHLIRDRYVQAEVYPGGKYPYGQGPPPASDAQVTALLRADPATARFVAETQSQVIVPGIAEPIPYYAYHGDSSWIGYALIHGRWFAKPGEVVAPTRLLDEAHLRVGDTMTAHLGERLAPVRLRIVGEILDQSDGDLLLRGEWSTLAAVAPGLQPQMYEVGLKPGANAEAFARRLRNPYTGIDASAAESSSGNTSFVLLQGVIAGLALILTAIAAAGVFNTVVLNTREKARDVAILKAVGMAPAQVVGMVVASVAGLGLVAGVAGIPIGLALHRQILQFMGRIASGTAMPASFFDLIPHAALPLLALCGMAVAALGAWLPAQWAASSGVAEVLQAE